MPAAAKSTKSGQHLPAFIAPMLATPGKPFDSSDHLFEIKWDGTRGLAFIEGGAYRLVNRRRIDFTNRYPEFSFLNGLPPGTVLDGEVVVLHGGKPDFDRLMARDQLRSPLKIKTSARAMPATFIVFDVLYEKYASLMSKPLHQRRDCLQALVQAVGDKHFVMSQGIVGAGAAFFHEAVKQNLEGVVAKRLDSRYLPGKRSPAWVKIKRFERVFCAIIGFIPSGNDDFRSLVIAAECDGCLRTVGKVGTGFDARLRAKLNELLWPRVCERPIVTCRERARWVTPGLYCWVSCMERTKGGELRAPVFAELCVE